MAADRIVHETTDIPDGKATIARSRRRKQVGRRLPATRRSGGDRVGVAYRAKNGNKQKNTIVELSRIPNCRSSKCHLSNGFVGLVTCLPSLRISCS